MEDDGDVRGIDAQPPQVRDQLLGLIARDAVAGEQQAVEILDLQVGRGQPFLVVVHQAAVAGLELAPQGGGQGADHQHPAVGGDHRQHLAVEEAEPVRAHRFRGDRAVELAVVEDVVALHPCLQGGPADVPGVVQAVDMADLVPVEGRDGQFADAQPGDDELDDDLRVEVEVVGIEVKGHGCQGPGAVQPVAAVELAQSGAEQQVLEAGEDLVAHELVQRHAAAQGPAPVEHARAEHRLRLAAGQHRDQLGQTLGRVLAVAVHQRHPVEAVFDGVVESDLLVAAVALVDRVEQHGQLEGHDPPAVGQFAAQEGVVPGGVVDDEHLHLVARRQIRGDPPEHVLDGPLGVVGDDEDEQPAEPLRGRSRIDRACRPGDGVVLPFCHDPILALPGSTPCPFISAPTSGRSGSAAPRAG